MSFKRILGVFLVFFLFYIDMSCLKAAPNATAEELESSEEKRRQLLTTVEAAKQYQDMMDEQMSSLKSENKELHEKLLKLKNQFESAVSGVASSLEKNMKQQAVSPVVTPVPPQAPVKAEPQVNTPVQQAPDSPPPTKMPETTVKMPEEKPQPAPVIPKEPIVEKTVEAAPLVSSLHVNKTDKLLLALSDIKFIGSFLVLAILLLMWFFWGKRSKKADLPELKTFNEKKAAFSHEHADKTQELVIPAEQMIIPVVAANQEGEYDYIGSAEAVPARLDLARMYIDMGDIAQAELVLKSILAQGNGEQCIEAEKILIEMGKKTSS